MVRCTPRSLRSGIGRKSVGMESGIAALIVHKNADGGITVAGRILGIETNRDQEVWIAHVTFLSIDKRELKPQYEGYPLDLLLLQNKPIQELLVSAEKAQD